MVRARPDFWLLNPAPPVLMLRAAWRAVCGRLAQPGLAARRESRLALARRAPNYC